MTDSTKIRVQEIRRRTRQYKRRRERRALSSLTAFGLFLFAGIGALLQHVQAGGISAVTAGYGSVLLREGTGAYIVVGVAAFTAGAAMTVSCIRCRKKPSHRAEDTKDKEEKPI